MYIHSNSSGPCERDLHNSGKTRKHTSNSGTCQQYGIPLDKFTVGSHMKGVTLIHTFLIESIENTSSFILGKY